jgi:hypothetical protein
MALGGVERTRSPPPPSLVVIRSANLLIRIAPITSPNAPHATAVATTPTQVRGWRAGRSQPATCLLVLRRCMSGRPRHATAAMARNRGSAVRPAGWRAVTNGLTKEYDVEHTLRLLGCATLIRDQPEDSSRQRQQRCRWGPGGRQAGSELRAARRLTRQLGGGWTGAHRMPNTNIAPYPRAPQPAPPPRARPC